jgi:hypothetical protein
MPDTQRKDIVNGLSALRAVRATGKDGWVSFKSIDAGNWIQYASGTLNFDWPFRGEPDAAFVASFLQPLGELELAAWDIDTYATFNTKCHDWATLTEVIDDLFCRLYDLGPDYVVTWTVQEL